MVETDNISPQVTVMSYTYIYVSRYRYSEGVVVYSVF